MGITYSKLVLQSFQVNLLVEPIRFKDEEQNDEHDEVENERFDHAHDTEMTVVIWIVRNLRRRWKSWFRCCHSSISRPLK